jgi:hypothetical protein
MIDLIPFFLAPLLLLPPELCKVPRSLLHRTRMGMPKKSCDLKCGKYPPSNLFKSVQICSTHICLCHFTANKCSPCGPTVPAMTMTYTKLSGESVSCHCTDSQDASIALEGPVVSQLVGFKMSCPKIGYHQHLMIDHNCPF